MQFGTIRTQPHTASPGYPNTHEKQDNDLKSHLMKMIEAFKKNINNSLKEIQENTIKQVKELNKMVQELKMEIEIIKNLSIKKAQGQVDLVQNSPVLQRRTGTNFPQIIP